MLKVSLPGVKSGISSSGYNVCACVKVLLCYIGLFRNSVVSSKIVPFFIRPLPHSSISAGLLERNFILRLILTVPCFLIFFFYYILFIFFKIDIFFQSWCALRLISMFNNCSAAFLEMPFKCVLFHLASSVCRLDVCGSHGGSPSFP